MFLGVRDELDDELGQAFLETGTIHLLVVSGLNVGILAMCLWGLERVGFVRRLRGPALRVFTDRRSWF